MKNHEPGRKAVGGKNGGSHAHRRVSAQELKNQLYKALVKQGFSTRKARQIAVRGAVEHLGHSRNRKDLAKAYLE